MQSDGTTKPISERSQGGYLLTGVAKTFWPTLLFGAIVVMTPLRSSLVVPLPQGLKDQVFLAIGLLVTAPWIESAFMFPVIWALRKVGVTERGIPLSVGLMAVVLHATQSFLGGLFVFWPFYVFTQCLVKYRAVSVNRALVMTALMHTGYNLLVVLFRLALEPVL